PLHDRLKKNPPPWTDKHSDIIRFLKTKACNLLCLYLPVPHAFKIVETDASDLGYGVRVDCKLAKDVLQNDVKNLASKQIFVRWQAILSVFDFDIEHIKGNSNSLPNSLTREYL
ncbi:hypothetical protein S245_048817, partial [Arachis hypogaea]